MKRTLLHNNRGQVFATAGVTILVVMAMAGLAADGGIYLEGRRRAQTAADAAAMAGAVEVWRNSAATYGTINTSAQAGAAQNGFTDGTDNVTVTINHPPTLGSYKDNNKFVEAIVTHQLPTTLMAAVGYTTMTPAARAVAGPVNAAICALALKPTDAGITVNLGTIAGESCSVIANSSSSTAISTPNLSSSITADSISVVASSDPCHCTPAAQTNSLITPDPLAGLAAPPLGDCTAHPTTVTVINTQTLSPGTYCGGITIIGPSANATFNPGNYVIKDGKLFISGGAHASGTGVTFYLTSSVSGTCGTTVPQVNILGGTVVALSAPTSGPYANVLFFQSRDVGTSCGAIFQGGANMTLNGALYFPKNSLSFVSGSSANACTEIVADTITFLGSSSLGSSCSGFEDGALFSKVALAD